MKSSDVGYLKRTSNYFSVRHLYYTPPIFNTLTAYYFGTDFEWSCVD
jgi:hypothetical protein